MSSEANLGLRTDQSLYIGVDQKILESKISSAQAPLIESEILSKADQCTYLMLISVNDTTYEVHWVEVGCFERFWRWLLSCFGCCESTVEKCKQISMELFKSKINVEKQAKNAENPYTPVLLDSSHKEESQSNQITQISSEKKEELKKFLRELDSEPKVKTQEGSSPVTDLPIIESPERVASPVSRISSPSNSQTPVTSPKSPRVKPEKPKYEYDDKSRNYLDTLKDIADENATINQCIGLLMGAAIGDALGLATKNMDQTTARKVTQDGLSFSTRMYTPEFAKYEAENDINWSKQRMEHPFGGWSENMDQTLCLIDASEAADLSEDEESSMNAQQFFAQKLIEWSQNGIQGRNYSAQKNGREMINKPSVFCRDQLVGSVMGILPEKDTTLMHQFEEDPKSCAIKAWNNPELAFLKDSNGALVRSAPMAYLYHDDRSKLINRSVEMCEVTHVDPRCVASCVALNTAIFYLLQGEKDYEAIRKQAFEQAEIILKQKMSELKVDSTCKASYLSDLREAIWATSLENLDDNGTLNNISGTYQCLGVAFAALVIAGKQRTAKDPFPEAVIFRNVITSVVEKGGNAPANASVASAMLGAAFGFTSTFHTWRQLRDISVLQKYIG